MRLHTYPLPVGVHAIPDEQLDLRSDAEIDYSLLHPGSITSEKNIWFFWHSGFTNMHGYTKRNIRAWHRRFSRKGWIIRVLDRLSGSQLNVANFLDIRDPETFPKAFIDGIVGGHYAAQHVSDLVRWPLLLKYGGVYADVGLMQIGDLDLLWEKTIGDNTSKYEVFSYNGGGVGDRCLMNYFLASGKQNPLFARCHKLLLQLWAEDGGNTSTEGMHASPLLEKVPLMGEADGNMTMEDVNGEKLGNHEVRVILSDYIVQGQVMTLVTQLVDADDDWDGPKYTADHVYAIEYMQGSQLINEMTAWDGQRAFELMSLYLPEQGEAESADQKKAREIVEACLQKSFGFKLAHGLVSRVLGETLGTLWRKHEGSDDVPGTYAHWLRYGTLHWCPDILSPTLEFEAIKPLKTGHLLGQD